MSSYLSSVSYLLYNFVKHPTTVYYISLLHTTILNCTILLHLLYYILCYTVLLHEHYNSWSRTRIPVLLHVHCNAWSLLLLQVHCNAVLLHVHCNAWSRTRISHYILYCTYIIMHGPGPVSPSSLKTHLLRAALLPLPPGVPGFGLRV